MIDSTARQVELVCSFYRSIVGREFGKRVRPKVKPGSKTETSVLAFWDLQGQTGRSVIQLLEASMGQYSSGWCVQTFHVPYPPLTVVVSEKSRTRLARSLSRPVGVDATFMRRQAAEMAATVKAALGLEGALELLDSGWPADNMLRVRMKKALSC